MVVLFAGLDSTGQVRYLDEVPSGLACECTCLTCGAALVARKGSINDWHFAHQNGQQNPECLAGARNLLRQLTAQTLRERGSLPATQPYATMIRAEKASERFTWGEQERIESIDWQDPTGPRATAAELVLTEGRRAELRIAVEGESWGMAAGREHQGLLVVTVGMPDGVAFRSREALVASILGTMQAKWECPAGHHAWYARARSQVQAKSDAFRSKFEAARALFEQRRVAMQPLAAGPVPRDPVNLPQDPSFVPEPPLPEWAVDHKPGTSMLCYQLRDGERWVLYETIASGYLLRQWPEPQDGWDESFPPSLGSPDLELGAYKVSSYHQFIPAFGRYSAGTRSTSDARAVGAQFESLLKP
ncbi:hypothetical protein CBP36_21165 (plasmid) [Acidovorax carolinensis]|uniref:Competence protein CoiA n=1 Tax=Acidovorax carolinensis TaxID=553814 RepID=A0A240UKD3_9BURK|nr:hypothetical protein [Acidovorax carolinensis]ART61480.1 hypothetical protein CBP36_21165 [Acidovorax carolinensis]